MIESHLHAGSQSFPRPLEELKYGVSITDGCIDWSSTEACLRRSADVIDKARFS
jgi:3-deoxy-7-phosphoheptulonate synthase